MPKLRKVLKEAERLDVEAALRLAEWRDNPVVKALAGLAGIADQPPAVTAGALLLALALLRRDARLGEAAIRLVAAILVTTMLKTGVERAVARTRPNAVLDGRPYSRRRGGSRKRALQAFPSGHTADAVAAARALARAYPDLALPIWGAAALIALVQLPAAAHYPSDIAAGAVIGLLGEEAAQRAADAVAGWISAGPAPQTQA
jgi:membrane-associated phospholipid phosphatase